MPGTTDGRLPPSPGRPPARVLVGVHRGLRPGGLAARSLPVPARGSSRYRGADRRGAPVRRSVPRRAVVVVGGFAVVCVALPVGLALVQPESSVPPAQQAFTAAVARGQAGMDADPHELKRRQLRQRRDQAVCAAVPDRVVTDWIGRVDEVFLDGQALAGLSVELGHDIRLATHDDRDDDAQADTLLPEGSAVYQALVDLEEGDAVRFSGLLLPGDDGCLDERSLTSSGAMSSPTWLFRFTAVAPATDEQGG